MIIRFAGLDIGQKFYYYDECYMRVSCSVISHEKYLAVSIKNGIVCLFNEDDKVEPVHWSLVAER